MPAASTFHGPSVLRGRDQRLFTRRAPGRHRQRMFHSILAAVDGSRSALDALHLGRRIAFACEARLTPFTAEDPAAPAILREIAEGGHDLVVMGSRGRGGIGSALLGSVARSVVGGSEVPVLVARLAAPPHGHAHERILVAVDGTPGSNVAVELAADLAHAMGGRLTLVSVAGVRHVPGRPESASVRIRRDAEEHARAVLRAALRRVPEGVPVTLHVAWGQVEAALLEQLASGGHDLLVLGSRGMGHLRGTLLGSTGYAMLRRSPVPVLIARRPAPAPAAPPARRPAGAVGAGSL
jgi:nucleotide-binding universal stress UspA family protein